MMWIRGYIGVCCSARGSSLRMRVREKKGGKWEKKGKEREKKGKSEEKCSGKVGKFDFVLVYVCFHCYCVQFTCVFCLYVAIIVSFVHYYVNNLMYY